MADTPIFDGSDAEDDEEPDRSKMPVLENDSEGAAAWLNTDRNGNAYFRVRLPLGLGSLSLFPANDRIEDALNQLSDYLEDQE
ncbi:MAG: hypothetical protein ABEK12_04010 [Candidatus Nanohaloarchaea archaeon]